MQRKSYDHILCNFMYIHSYAIYSEQKVLFGFTRISLIVYEKLISNRNDCIKSKYIKFTKSINYHKTI